MSLREKVCIKTPTGDFEGELYVGVDGLPELRMVAGDVWSPCYRPATFPATWSLIAIGGRAHGVLLQAWIDISDIRSAVVDAQREAEAEAEA